MARVVHGARLDSPTRLRPRPSSSESRRRRLRCQWFRQRIPSRRLFLRLCRRRFHRRRPRCQWFRQGIPSRRRFPRFCRRRSRLSRLPLSRLPLSCRLPLSRLRLHSCQRSRLGSTTSAPSGVTTGERACLRSSVPAHKDSPLPCDVKMQSAASPISLYDHDCTWLTGLEPAQNPGWCGSCR